MLMGKHAYLIMAHNQWELLEQLLFALDDERNDIYLHIDKKTSPPREQIESAVHKAKLFWTKRYNIVWGGTQMMECTLNMLEQASQNGYSCYHLISGADFPIKSQNYIHQFFQNRPEEQFVGFDWSGINSGRFLSRVQYYHFLINIIGKRDNSSLMHRLLSKIEDVSLTIQSKLHINRIDYEVYKGSSWFSITHSAVMAVLSEKDAILKRYSFGANTDEIWLQTFLMESGFADRIADSNMRYIKWIQGNPSPETLTIADYEDLIASEKLFARKFDWNRDPEVIVKLKEHITKEQ